MLSSKDPLHKYTNRSQPATRRFTSDIIITCINNCVFRNETSVGFTMCAKELLQVLEEQCVLVICAAIMHALYDQRQKADGRKSTLDLGNSMSEYIPIAI
jgi:hypothetical protein